MDVVLPAEPFLSKRILALMMEFSAIKKFTPTAADNRTTE
jgi:hypothetical protein